ncbi:MAG TPA: tripartite tricarboxylate transporter substrate binding protein [Nitrospira sp.]|nr:tripartite tricarboxylate transporter substrate binding protein [Nitrospira sp.]
MQTRRTLLALLCLTAAVAPAVAQDQYPSRPVKIILSLPAGSSPDVRTRIVAHELGSIWGRQVVVENRPGGGGIVGAQAALSAPADGYTIFASPGSIFTILPALDKLPFNVNRDFVPLGLMSVEGAIVAVSPKLGINTLGELIALANKEPHKVAIGTTSAGSFPHFAGMLLAERSKAPFTVVPYSKGGTVEAIRDILGGRIHAVVEPRPGLVGALDGGQIKALAIMSNERISIMPDLPTALETVPGLTAIGWMGMVAPRGTPEPIVRQLSRDLRKVFEKPEIVAKLAQIGTPFRPLYGAEFARFIEDEQKLWLPMIRQFNARH